jgi:hypothetical protein
MKNFFESKKYPSPVRVSRKNSIKEIDTIPKGKLSSLSSQKLSSSKERIFNSSSQQLPSHSKEKKPSITSLNHT